MDLCNLHQCWGNNFPNKNVHIEKDPGLPPWKPVACIAGIQRGDGRVLLRPQSRPVQRDSGSVPHGGAARAIQLLRRRAAERVGILEDPQVSHIRVLHPFLP